MARRAPPPPPPPTRSAPPPPLASRPMEEPCRQVEVVPRFLHPRLDLSAVSARHFRYVHGSRRGTEIILIDQRSPFEARLLTFKRYDGTWTPLQCHGWGIIRENVHVNGDFTWRDVLWLRFHWDASGEPAICKLVQMNEAAVWASYYHSRPGQDQGGDRFGLVMLQEMFHYEYAGGWDEQIQSRL